MPQVADTSRDATPTDMDELIVRADARGHILYVSDGCRLLGYEPDELMGQLGFAFVHPDDRAKFAANTASLYSNVAAPSDRRHRFRCKDGSWLWFEGHPRVVATHDGRLGDIVNVFRLVQA